MKTTLIVAVMFAAVLTAEARVGETLAQLKARYGRPDGESPEDIGYNRNGYRWACNLERGKCVRETYWRADLKPMDEREIKSWLVQSVNEWTPDGTNRWVAGGYVAEYKGKALTIQLAPKK
jgi:hypothetical protein